MTENKYKIKGKEKLAKHILEHYKLGHYSCINIYINSKGYLEYCLSSDNYKECLLNIDFDFFVFNGKKDTDIKIIKNIIKGLDYVEAILVPQAIGKIKSDELINFDDEMQARYHRLEKEIEKTHNFGKD